MWFTSTCVSPENDNCHSWISRRERMTVENILWFILLPETDNCPSRISRKERITIANISWSISMKEYCRTRGSNPPPPVQQADAHPAVSHWGRLLISFSWKILDKIWDTVFILNTHIRYSSCTFSSTTSGIFTFLSRENFMLSCFEHEKSFITSGHMHRKYKQKHFKMSVHYENTPIQIYRKFHLQKLKIFR